jgi:hypothetical protein
VNPAWTHFDLSGQADGTGAPVSRILVQGVFRVYYVASSCSREAVCELPFSETVSNQFRVQLAQ